ncbi:MAG: radical SAM protein [Elusimicrobiales bacterium]|nr:radical SAM protein [Elusimicrobiales bacterium]
MTDAEHPRVLLLNPPSALVQVRDFYCSVTAKAGYYWAPIDLLVISGRLPAGAVTVLDAVADRLSPGRALEEAAAAAPRVVISLTSSASMPEDMPFLEELKRRTGCAVAVCGNVCLDPLPWLLETYPWLDALITDFTSPGIAGYAAARGKAERPIPGMICRKNGGFLDGRAEPSTGGGLSYPVPRHELFPLRAYRLPYALNRPIATVMTSYGCPFDCGFCIQGRGVIGYRSRSLPEVVEELARLRSLGARELYFRDPLFGSDRALAEGMCLEMKRGFSFSWSCDSRVDVIDEGLIKMMKEAGCSLIAFGMETANKSALLRQKKTLGEESLRAAPRLCRKHGVKTAGYFILGLPGEDLESSLETIKFALDSGVDFASFSIASPDFGTRLRMEAIKNGDINPGEFREFDRNCVSRSLCDGLDAAGLEILRKKALRDFYARPSYILRTLAGMRSLNQLKEGVRSALALARNCL